eukprot:11163567-Ditylum_brightwellii.AAC.1
MERSKRNKHLVCDEDIGVDICDNDVADSADKHLVHLSQAADCCRTERNKQNEHLVCDEDDGVDNGDDDSIDN